MLVRWYLKREREIIYSVDQFLTCTTKKKGFYYCLLLFIFTCCSVIK